MKVPIIDMERFYLDKEEPNKSCLLTLRDIILDHDRNITETRKYGMPCFCYQGKMFCYLWVDKKTKQPYILMVEGRNLHHPQLERGSRTRMKILKINPTKDLQVGIIQSILNEAVDLYRKGIIKT